MRSSIDKNYAAIQAQTNGNWVNEKHHQHENEKKKLKKIIIIFCLCSSFFAVIKRGIRKKKRKKSWQCKKINDNKNTRTHSN
jgi:hypothetical protein